MTLLRSVLGSSHDLIVECDRVTLRAPQADDFESWAKVRAESRTFLKPWEPTWPKDDLTKAAFRRRLRRYRRDQIADQSYAFFLIAKTTGDVIGGLTLSNVRRGVTQAATLGYWMGAPFAGSGFMTEAVKGIIPVAFDELLLHRLEAACLPSNEASVHLLEKVGFQREGFARGLLKIDGDWRDHLLFATLKEDHPGLEFPAKAPTVNDS